MRKVLPFILFLCFVLALPPGSFAHRAERSPNVIPGGGGGGIVDISDETNLATTEPVLLTGDTVGFAIYFDVTRYGATGDGVTDDRAAVNNAGQAATLTGGAVLFPNSTGTGDYRISSDMTFNSDVTLVFDPGANLFIDSGDTVIINGRIAPTLHQIFSGSGSVDLGTGSCEYVLPQWWGAVGDDSTDCYAAFTSAIAALNNGGGQLYIPAGIYRVSASLDNFPIAASLADGSDGVAIRGSGNQTILKYTGASGYLFSLQNDNAASSAQVSYCSISDLHIQVPTLTATGGGIEVSKANVNRFERITFTNFDSTYGVGVALRNQNVTLTEDSFTTDTNRDFTTTGAGASEKYAIKFTPSLVVAGYVKQVTVRLGKTGVPAGTITARIYSDAAGPNTALGENSAAITATTLNAAADGGDVTFTFENWLDMPTVANGTDYWLVLTTTGYTYADGVTEIRLRVDAGAGGVGDFATYDAGGMSWSTSNDGSNNTVLMRTAYKPIWNVFDGLLMYGTTRPAIGVKLEDQAQAVIVNSNFYTEDVLVANGTTLFRMTNCHISANGDPIDVTGGISTWTDCYIEGGTITFDGGALHQMIGCHIGSDIDTTVGTPLTLDRCRKQLYVTEDPSVIARDYGYKIYTADRIMVGYDDTAGEDSRGRFWRSTNLTLAVDEYALTGNTIQTSTSIKGFKVLWDSGSDVRLPRGTYQVTVVAKDTNAVANDLQVRLMHVSSNGVGLKIHISTLTLTPTYKSYQFHFPVTETEVARLGTEIFLYKATATTNTISVSHVILEYLGPDTPFRHDLITYNSQESDADGARESQVEFRQKTLGSEVLSETDFATHANWNVTGDFDDTGGNAAYSHSTGSGTLTQPSGSFANAATNKARYRFEYTVSGSAGDPAAEITTVFSHESSMALDLTDGTHVLHFYAKSGPGDFVISATSVAGDAFTLDDLSLRTIIAYSTLADITASHDGSSADEKGKLEFGVNDGDDGFSPTVVVTIDSAGDVTLTGDLGANNLSGTNTGDDDIPEAGDFAAAADLDLNGQVADDSHAHTTATISGLDVSDDLNLVAGTNITLVGDTLNVDDAFVSNTGDDVAGEVTTDNEDWIPNTVIVPEPDGADNNTVEHDRVDTTNRKIYLRITGVADGQDMNLYATWPVNQTPTSLTFETRVSERATGSFTMDVLDVGGNADATGQVDIEPSADDTWEGMTYTFTSAYVNDEMLWIIVIADVDKDETAEITGMTVNY